MIDVTAIAIVSIVFGTPVAVTAAVLRYRLRARELDIRRMEAERQLLEARRVGELPDYIDKDDPAAVREWEEARREMDRLVARQAAVARTR